MNLFFKFLVNSLHNSLLAKFFNVLMIQLNFNLLVSTNVPSKSKHLYPRIL